MLGIVDAKFAVKLSKLGGMAILHRFYKNQKEWYKEINYVKKNRAHLGISIGMQDSYQEFLAFNPEILLIDVANGYTNAVLGRCAEIKNYIVQNECATSLGVARLRDAGADLVRVGIGGGALCSTRNATGVGIPQITAIQDCANVVGIKIVADGGIGDSGDAAKAFVAGADVVMLGSLFGSTYESPAKKRIFGMASKRLQDMRFTQIKSVEGIEKEVVKKWHLKEFVDEFSWNLRSTGTYIDARNLREFRINGTFVPTGIGSIKNL
jgi:IMP dehydrogenase/GMP reductase